LWKDSFTWKSCWWRLDEYYAVIVFFINSMSAAITDDQHKLSYSYGSAPRGNLYFIGVLGVISMLLLYLPFVQKNLRADIL
jgi:hypothetical protein